MAFFNELNDLINITVGEYMLNDQDLCKLLYYYPKTEDKKYTFDPLSQPNIPDTSILIPDYIYTIPKRPDAQTEQKAMISVTLSSPNRSYGDNIGFRKMWLLFDIICHLDAWWIQDGLRVYDIAAHIDEFFNNKITKLPAFSNSTFVGLWPKDYNYHYYGLQLCYSFTVNSNIDCDPEPNNLGAAESTMPDQLRAKLLEKPWNR